VTGYPFINRVKTQLIEWLLNGYVLIGEIEGEWNVEIVDTEIEVSI
jgi:hypothetical protein